jgi:pimeloyl-ACP methyl ester carboxylesterase
MELSSVEFDGIELTYRTAGEAGLLVVVLLHALGQDSSDWNVVVEALAPAHRVYALDLRGHGGSSQPGAYPLELMRSDVLGFLHALDLDGAFLIGHSVGGAVAYLVAAAEPRRVRRLVLEEPAPPRPGDAIAGYAVPARRNPLLRLACGGGDNQATQRPRPRVVGRPAPHHRPHAGDRRRPRQPLPARPTRRVGRSDPRRVIPDDRRRVRRAHHSPGSLPCRVAPIPASKSHRPLQTTQLPARRSVTYRFSGDCLLTTSGRMVCRET